MYSSIKVVCLTPDGPKNIKTSRKNNSVAMSEQDIVLKVEGHTVARARCGYVLVLEYHSPREEYLYEVVVRPTLRLYCLSLVRLAGVREGVDVGARRLCGLALEEYRGGRKAISEANHYYLFRFNR
jgi:hypothetical protein